MGRLTRNMGREAAGTNRTQVVQEPAGTRQHEQVMAALVGCIHLMALILWH